MENNKEQTTQNNEQENNDEYEPLSTRKIIVDNAVVGFATGVVVAAINYCTTPFTKETRERIHNSACVGLASGASVTAQLAVYDLIITD